MMKQKMNKNMLAIVDKLKTYMLLMFPDCIGWVTLLTIWEDDDFAVEIKHAFMEDNESKDIMLEYQYSRDNVCISEGVETYVKDVNGEQYAPVRESYEIEEMTLRELEKFIK